MIIELYGLPGAGKTTLARDLAVAQGFKIIKLRSKKELLTYNLIFFLRQPIKFFGLFYYVIRYNGGSCKLFYYKFMNCFLHPNGKLMKARHYQKAIIDQGHWQNLLSLFEKPIKPSIVKKYFRFMVQADYLFILKINRAELERRIKRRGYFARPWQSNNYLARWQEVLFINDKIVRQTIKKLPVKYCLLDRPQPKERILLTIKQCLNEQN